MPCCAAISYHVSPCPIQPFSTLIKSLSLPCPTLPCPTLPLLPSLLSSCPFLPVSHCTSLPLHTPQPSDPGSVFWSTLVTWVNSFARLDSLPEEQQNYLSVIILLMFLLILPFIFDTLARNYEGMKLESEIQNAIMTRYTSLLRLPALYPLLSSVNPSLLTKPSSVLLSSLVLLSDFALYCILYYSILFYEG